MSSEDLKSAVRTALEDSGVMNELRSKMRAELFKLMEDDTFEKPRVSQENLLINELIREYMEFNSYRYSKSVFMKETNQPETPLNREIIAAELHIKEDKTTKQVPLLYSILWNFLNAPDEEIIDDDDEREQRGRRRDSSDSFVNGGGGDKRNAASANRSNSRSPMTFSRQKNNRNSSNSNKSKNINIYRYNENLE